MTEHTVEQGSDAWFRLRRGIPTASQFGRIVSDKTGKRLADTARTYLCELAYERLTGTFYRKDLSGNEDVQRGNRLEPDAVAVFECLSGLKTRTCGIFTNSECTLGASPDRVVVGRKEGVEVKCPRGPKHISHIAYGLGNEHRAQVQGQILLAGFVGVHFISYNEEFASYVEYVEPDRKFLADLALALAEFTVELDRVTNHVRRWGVFPRNDILPSFPADEDTDEIPA